MQVIYPVPVYTGIVVMNPPEHPDYSRRNPNSQGSKKTPAPAATTPVPLTSSSRHDAAIHHVQVHAAAACRTSRHFVQARRRDARSHHSPDHACIDAAHGADRRASTCRRRGRTAPPLERPSPVPIPVGRDTPRVDRPEPKPENKPESKPAPKTDSTSDDKTRPGRTLRARVRSNGQPPAGHPPITGRSRL